MALQVRIRYDMAALHGYEYLNLQRLHGMLSHDVDTGAMTPGYADQIMTCVRHNS